MTAHIAAWRSRTALKAEMARAGLHDLQPHHDPERGYCDPLDDRETRQAVKAFLQKLWESA